MRRRIHVPKAPSFRILKWQDIWRFLTQSKTPNAMFEALIECKICNRSLCRNKFNIGLVFVIIDQHKSLNVESKQTYMNETKISSMKPMMKTNSLSLISSKNFFVRKHVNIYNCVAGVMMCGRPCERRRGFM
jgi:hypothetical protein